MELSLAQDRRLLPEETPWRSRFYVPGHLSADGQDYAPGDPIPPAEAVRQGQVEADKVLPIQPKTVCPRCRGGGRYSRKQPKGHGPRCSCHFCSPCPKCGGGGFVVA